MGRPRKARSWRQCLADDFEVAYGPLPDPVATFGSELVTAPPTPVLSSSIAEPDPLFISRLQQSIECIADSSCPKCLQNPSRLDCPQDSSSDSDEPDAAPWSLQAYATRLFERASRNAIKSEEPATSKPRRPAKRLREQDSMARAPPRKRPRRDQNGPAKSEHDSMQERSILPARPERRTRRSTQRQHPHSPPQTSSPTPPASPVFAVWQAGSPPEHSTTQKTHPVSTPPSTESPTPPVDSPPYRPRLTRVRFRCASGPTEAEMPPG
ncbi:hypothetical protein EDB80DRAFT_874723 [Ilyonectria destructans]|nr:hypothetical protein EDB80DRAFT_874723 [Ilyonectria destructans]